MIRVCNALAPPLRPSSEDIGWYEQGWADWEGSKVLIQGVTPELLDLALRKKAARYGHWEEWSWSGKACQRHILRRFIICLFAYPLFVPSLSGIQRARTLTCLCFCLCS